MINIEYLVGKYNLSFDTNSELGKKVMNIINKNTTDNDTVKIIFNSTKSYNKQKFEKMINTKIVELGNNIDTPVDFTKLINLIEITIGKVFNSNLVLPDSVEKIICHDYSIFNFKIKNYPKKLKYLKFGICFNQPVDNLPDKLEYLKFGDNFNQPIKNLPDKLEYLYLGQCFNHDLDFLPESVITLEFYYHSMFFSKSLDNLPISLKSLLLSSTVYDNNNKLSVITTNYYNNLPDNISFLRISNLKNISKFPKKINKLIIINSDEFFNIINIDNHDKINEIEIHFIEMNIFDVFFSIKNIKKMTISSLHNKHHIYGEHNNKYISFIEKKTKELNDKCKIKIIKEYGYKIYIFEKK